MCKPITPYKCTKKKQEEKTQNKETGEGKKTTVQITSTMLVHRFVPIVDHVFVS